MEFEEMKTIWDEQNKETLYVINEQALHNRILAKKKRAGHFANFSELLLITVNIASGVFNLYATRSRDSNNLFLYLTAGWMFITAAYVLFSRRQRLNIESRFDLSMRGSLEHALSNATYQVRLSLLMRWNIVPIGALVIMSLLESGKPVWTSIVIFIFFALVYLAGGWEHSIYRSRMEELEILKRKLIED